MLSAAGGGDKTGEKPSKKRRKEGETSLYIFKLPLSRDEPAKSLFLYKTKLELMASIIIMMDKNILLHRHTKPWFWVLRREIGFDFGNFFWILGKNWIFGKMSKIFGFLENVSILSAKYFELC